MTIGFVNASVLALLLILPLAVVFFVWRERVRLSSLLRIGEADLLRQLLPPTSQTRHVVKTGLWLLALAALIVALARPVWGVDAEIVETQGVSVMLVLDVSASMNAQDVAPSRLERARLMFRELIQTLAGNEIGLILFAGSAFVQFPLTTDTLSAETLVKAASSDSLSNQGTALEAALRLAVDSFDTRTSAARFIVVATDGESHDDQPLAAADEAAQRDIIIDAIGYGGAQGEPIPLRDADGNAGGYKTDAAGNLVLSALDEQTLKAITERANGVYLRGGSGDEIRVLIDQISRAQAGRLETRVSSRGVERFGMFVALALFALSLEILLRENGDDHS
jgi:Ca-activated chloride channel family protein